MISSLRYFKGGTNPILGSVARLFEDEGGGKYTFYMDYGTRDANGNTDGGLYYNNDKNMAGFIATGFQPAASVGVSGSFTVKDGPRCWDEYNYCFAAAKNPKLQDPHLITGYVGSTGARTYFFKRIK